MRTKAALASIHAVSPSSIAFKASSWPTPVTGSLGATTHLHKAKWGRKPQSHSRVKKRAFADAEAPEHHTDGHTDIFDKNGALQL